MPGTTSPQPSPFVHVTAHAQPSSSIAEMWVVEPSRWRNSGVRSRLRRLHRRDQRAARRVATAPASSIRSACASSVPPALGGGLVTTVEPRYATRTGARGTAS